MEVINRAWECRPNWTGSNNLSEVPVQKIKETNYRKRERERESETSRAKSGSKGKAQKSMNGNEEAENSRYQNLKKDFVVSPHMNALCAPVPWNEENDKSRWMPLKWKSIIYLINSVIFGMFPWDVGSVHAAEKYKVNSSKEETRSGMLGVSERVTKT